MEHVLLYSIGAIDKAILDGLRRYGHSKTFAELLADAGFFLDYNGQIELAINLEALELIQDVRYTVPIEIRAELTLTGAAIVDVEHRTLAHTPPGISIHMLGRQAGFPAIGIN